MSSNPLPPFAALRAFAAVGRLGGFRSASEWLGVDHAIVSRHIRALEQQLGTVLIERKTRRMTLDGERFHARIEAAITELHAAAEEVRSSTKQQLTIWSSPGLALHWLAPNAGKFSASPDNPSLSIHSSEQIARLGRGEADCDIRYELDWATSFDHRGVGRIELDRPLVFPVASPGWLAALARPIARAEDLLGLALIEENGASEWNAWFAAQGITRSPLKSAPHQVTRHGQAHLTLAAARAGQGIALSNRLLATDDLEAGRLEIVGGSAAFVPIAFGAYIFRYAKGGRNADAIERFSSWLMQQFTQQDQLPGRQ